jgi:succinate dehydrogenase hydrophobic anchor subunit
MIRSFLTSLAAAVRRLHALPHDGRASLEQRWGRSELEREAVAVADALGSRRPTTAVPEAYDPMDDFATPVSLDDDEDKATYLEAPVALRLHLWETQLLAYGLALYAVALGSLGVFVGGMPWDQWVIVGMGTALYLSMTHARAGALQVARDYTPRDATRSLLEAVRSAAFWATVNTAWAALVFTLFWENLSPWMNDLHIWQRAGVEPAVFMEAYNTCWGTAYGSFLEGTLEARSRNIMEPVTPWHARMYLFGEQTLRLVLNPLRGADEVVRNVYASTIPMDFVRIAFEIFDELVTTVAVLLARLVLNGPFALADTGLWLAQAIGLTALLEGLGAAPEGAWSSVMVKGPMGATAYQRIPSPAQWSEAAWAWWDHGMVVPRADADARGVEWPVGWCTPWNDWLADWRASDAAYLKARNTWWASAADLPRSPYWDMITRHRLDCWAAHAGLHDVTFSRSPEAFAEVDRIFGNPAHQLEVRRHLTDPSRLGTY